MNRRKFIVTHANPDQDAVSAIWLIRRFWSGWEDAETLFVPAGETLGSFQKKDVSAYKTINTKNADIVHVDTGFGEFDHHQSNEDTSAAKLVFEKTIRDNAGKHVEIDDLEFTVKRASYEVLDRMMAYINDIDHFREAYYPEANHDRYQFMLPCILDGLNFLYNSSGAGDVQVVSFAATALDGIYRLLQNKIGAEKEIDDRPSIKVTTKYGKAIGFETSNDAILDILQKNGYAITVRKDPNKQYIRIKSLPEKGIDLTPIYNVLTKKDPEATWFLHASLAMILNGSTKNPSMRPTNLSLSEIMEIVKKEFN